MLVNHISFKLLDDANRGTLVKKGKLIIKVEVNSCENILLPF
jgi:hypothetical protein